MDKSLNLSKSQSSDARLFNKPNSQNITVLLRIRPPLKTEYGKERAISCRHNQKTVVINTQSNLIESTLDGAFDENSTQNDVFQKVQQFVPAVIEGFNCTIFAYGQTGSGKTHTMFGSDWENVLFKNRSNHINIQNTFVGDINEDQNLSGLIPRTIYSLFREVGLEQNRSKDFAVYCSFLQVYNEKVFDLLTEKPSLDALNIRENQTDGLYVEGLNEYCVSKFEDCVTLMQKGERNRFIRHTSNNVKSSRSHTIFQLTVESTKADASGKLQKAKFNLCDLAGSEKLNKDEEIVNAHFKELKNINLSLTTLGKVIHNLSQNQKLPIPYRESKLTRLLQDSLGGNTRTCIIATLNPLLEYVDESLNTLKFAERAKHIVTEVKANKIEAVDSHLIGKLQNEIKYLKEILNIRRKGTSAINQVHNKLLILQEENDRLRQHKSSVQEVEKLVQENRLLKMELGQYKTEVTSDKGPDMQYSKDYRDFGATGGLSNYFKEGPDPIVKSITDKGGDVLDTITTNENKVPSYNFVQSFKSGKFFGSEDGNPYERRSRNTSEGPLSPTNHNSLSMTGKIITSTSSSGNVFNFNRRPNLPVRTQGKQSRSEAKMNAIKVIGQPNGIDQVRSDQQKAIRRLRDLEDWHKRSRVETSADAYKTKSKAIERVDLSHGNFLQESETTSINSNTNVISNNPSEPRKPVGKYQFTDFDKIYDPYKVRAEIERKYQPQRKTHVVGKPPTHKSGDYSSRLRNIEKNFF